MNFLEKNIPNHTSSIIPFWWDKQKKRDQSFKVFTFHFSPTYITRRILISQKFSFSHYIGKATSIVQHNFTRTFITINRIIFPHKSQAKPHRQFFSKTIDRLFIVFLFFPPSSNFLTLFPLRLSHIVENS